MPIRRTHKKSRLGCAHCRQRRIKCDEQLPECTACIRRGTNCHYSRLEVMQKQKAMRQKISLLPTETKVGELADSSRRAVSLSPGSRLEPSRLRELELMYHWCSKTYTSFTPDLGIAIREHISQEAVKFDFLMEALLALTSMHVAHETADRGTATLHLSAALRYQENAIVGLRNSLTALSQSNCNAIFSTATLVMMNSLISPLLSTLCIPQPRSPPATLLTLVDLLKGIHAIRQVSHSWLTQGPLARFFQPSSDFPPIHLSFPSHHLHDLADTESCRSTRRSFIRTIDALEWATRSMKTVIPWLRLLEDEFIARLKGHDPVALAIVMCWAVFVNQIRDTWWARYAGRQLVEDLATMLENIGPKFEVVTLWCRCCTSENSIESL